MVAHPVNQRADKTRPMRTGLINFKNEDIGANGDDLLCEFMNTSGLFWLDGELNVPSGKLNDRLEVYLRC